MQFKLTRKNTMLLSLCMLVFTVGLSLSLQINKTDTGIAIDTHNTIPFAHGAAGDGCNKCHIKVMLPPSKQNCAPSCHATPPEMLDQSVDFPHHDPNGYPRSTDEGWSHPSTNPPECNVCHNMHVDNNFPDCSSAPCHNTNDIRIIDRPEATHIYCKTCHEDDITHG